MKPTLQIKNVIIPCLVCCLITGLFENNIISQEFHGGVTMPVFNGGTKALKEFICHNLVFPDSIKKKGISGTVMVSLVIKSDGSPANVKLVRGINPVCDAEALRIARLLPAWQPALNWGKPVDCRILLPIDFMNERTVNKKLLIVSGTVSDKFTGQPLEGTLVIIKGTTSGTITDSNGQYRIEVSGEKDELEFSSFGYEVRTEVVGKSETLNIELTEGYYLINFNSEN